MSMSGSESGSESEINMRVRPFTIWVGGKRRLLPELLRLAPAKYNRYYEPFVGGGAMLFELMPKNALINDYNSDLIHAYKAIRDDVSNLIIALQEHENNNKKFGKEYYLNVRSADRNGSINDMSSIDKAARLLYMLRVDFNGLYRVNSNNQFNVPYGNCRNPEIVNERLLLMISEYFRACNIEMLNGDFENAVLTAGQGDFVYFDPPYAPVSATSSFTSYTCSGFGLEEQKRLKKVFMSLDDRGVKVMLSNSDVALIHELYGSLKNVNIEVVRINRLVGAKSSSRGKVNELIIRNYKAA